MKNLIENKRFHQFVLLLLIVILFINNGAVSLWDQDESAYAGFAYKMNETGNYLVPDFFWSEIHRKTPLHFWSIALSYKIFGVNEFAIRFPSALAISIVYLLVYFFVQKISTDKKTGLYAVVVLATSLFVPVLAKVSVTDGGLLLFSTLCAISVYKILNNQPFYWVLFFWCSFALALLIKGPPIVLFTGMLSVLLFILHSDRKKLFRLHPWFFLPLAAVPLVYWGYLSNKLDGGVFINWLVDWYILKRVSGSVLGQTGPPGMHIVVMMAVFLPYFMFFPRAVKQAIAGLFKRDNTNIFLGAWFIAGWLLWEFSPSKLPAYVVVAHVPLAILLGRSLAAYEPDKGYKILPYLQFALTSIVYTAFIAAPFVIELPKALTILSICFGAIMLVLNVFTFFVVAKRNFTTSLLGMNIFFQLMVWGVIIRQADNLKNTQKVVGAYIHQNAAEGSKVVIGNDTGTPPSLPFYTYLNFKDIVIEKDPALIGDIYDQYKQNIVFILNTEQRDALLAKEANLQFAEFNTMFTDRKDRFHLFCAHQEVNVIRSAAYAEMIIKRLNLSHL